MTTAAISPSLINSRPWSGFMAAMVLLAGCDRVESARSAQTARGALSLDDASSETIGKAVPVTVSTAELYSADLSRAVAGEKKVPFTTSDAFGGMTCSPEKISGATAASRTFTLTLPVSAAVRAYVLAVVTPERGLLEIYSPYNGPDDGEDVVVPSQVISWSKARHDQRFRTSSDALDALRPGTITPEPLFIEAGRYRFALVNSLDATVLRANGMRLRVEAACSFDWIPG